MTRIGMRDTAVWLLLSCICGAAGAATYEDGLRFKSEQKLDDAAAAFTEVSAAQPGNVDALEQLAIVQGWLKTYDASIASWRKAIALAPERAGLVIGLARVLYWKGEHAAALGELDTALASEPGNVDGLTLKGDVLLAQEQPEAARKAYAQAGELDGIAVNPDLDQKIARAVSPRAWRLDAGGTYDHYDNAREHEYSAYTQLGYRVSQKFSAYGRYEHFDYFDARDEVLTAGAYLLVSDWLLLNGEAGATVDQDDFRAKTLAGISAEILLDGPVQPLIAYRYLDYDNGEVSTITPGVRLLVSAAALELRYGFTDNVDGSNTEVFSARASYESERFSPYLAYANGEEALPPQALADIRIYGAGCVFNLGPSWGLRADYSFEDRKDIYQHDAFGLGLTYRY